MDLILKVIDLSPRVLLPIVVAFEVRIVILVPASAEQARDQ
jgi:hypothetical protein